MTSLVPAPVVASPSPFPTRAELLALRRKELLYARALGVAAGVFLVLVWSPLSFARWLGHPPPVAYFECGYFAFYGLVLLFPYSRVRAVRPWRILLGFLAVASLVFVFTLVFDVMYVYMAAADLNQTPPPPILNSALLFIGVLQVPTVLFSRHPDWLD
jgi:hypothetical protein